MELSIPRKLRGWNEPGDIRFVILHDQDNKDCVTLKKQLLEICQKNSERPFIVRIACQELEAWYFGDLNALAQAYGKPKLRRLTHQRKFRVPDSIPMPKEILQKLLPEYQEISGAQKIAPLMDIEQNVSTSFRQFVKGVRRLAI